MLKITLTYIFCLVLKYLKYPSVAVLRKLSLKVILGVFIEAVPMLLFHVNLGIMVACAALFGVAVIVGESMLKEDAEASALLTPREDRQM